MRLVFAGVVLVLAWTPARASGVEQALRSFGLLGTWAIECGLPVSADNPRVGYALAGGGVAHTFHISDADQSAGDVVVYAEVAAPDRLFLVLHRDGVPTLASVIRRVGETIQVTDSLNSAGKHLIIGGMLMGTNKAAATYRRCGD